MCSTSYMRDECGFGAKQGRCEYLDCISHLACSAEQRGQISRQASSVRRGVVLTGSKTQWTSGQTEENEEDMIEWVSGRWEMDGSCGQLDWPKSAQLFLPPCTHFFFLGFLSFYQGKMKNEGRKEGGRRPPSLLASSAHCAAALL